MFKSELGLIQKTELEAGMIERNLCNGILHTFNNKTQNMVYSLFEVNDFLKEEQRLVKWRT